MAQPISVRLPSALQEALDAYCKPRGLKRSAVIHSALRAYLGESPTSDQGVTEMISDFSARLERLERMAEDSGAL